MRASTPSYGRAFAMSNVPNLVPAPSGGVNTASVYNTSSDLVTNDIPSTFLIPSLHPDLIENNEFQEGDFVFALNPRTMGPNAYTMDYKSAFNGTTTIVTLPKLNALLHEYARKQADVPGSDAPAPDAGGGVQLAAGGSFQLAGEETASPWYASPEVVRAWARPLGVVLNKMRVNAGGHGRGNRPHYGINVCVSRRANVKNNFLSLAHAKERDWFGQSTMPLGVQYSGEHLVLPENNRQPISVVAVTMVLMDDSVGDHYDREEQEPMNISNGLRQNEDVVAEFGNRPRRGIVHPIGRVLNSCMRSPTIPMAINSCYSKQDYDSLPPIEVELGCA